MKSKTIIILLLSVLCAVAMPLHAQKKVLNQARDYIKSGQNLEKAESLLREQLKDSARRCDTKIWEMLVESITAQYDKGNESLYLKQKYDTLALFSTTRKLFSVMESMDSVDARPDEDGIAGLKFRQKHARYLRSIMPNLFYGGVFLVNKQKYDDAYEYFDHFISLPKLPLYSVLNIDSTSKMMVSAAYWTMYCGFKLNSPSMIMKHRELARRDTSQLAFVFQYEAVAQKLSHDTASYVRTLHEGFAKYPKFPYFFPCLEEYYNSTEQYDSALAIADRALAIDSANDVYRYAKSTALLNSGHYKECIAICKDLLAKNADFADANYNAGLAYFNMAVALDKVRQASRSKRRTMMGYYREALPYLEKYRTLAPDAEANWLSPLYTIYLNLNMGEKFDEIDKLRHEYKRNHK